MVLLHERPVLGHSFIQNLIVHDDVKFEKNNSILFNVYLQCLHTMLSEIESSQPEYCTNVMERFHELLALFNPPKSLQGLPFTKFLEDLCKICNVPQSPVKLDYVYSCLAGKSSLHILDDFSDILDNLHSKDNVVTDGDCFLNDVGRSLFRLCKDDNHMNKSVFAWKDLYLLGLSYQKHFLDTFIVSMRKCNSNICVVKSNGRDAHIYVNGFSILIYFAQEVSVTLIQENNFFSTGQIVSTRRIPATVSPHSACWMGTLREY